MPLVNTERAVPVRERLFRLMLNQGLLGAAVLTGVTLWRAGEAAAIAAQLDRPLLLLALLTIFATSLSLMKFPLSSEIFVSPAVIASIAMIPIVGLVFTSWICVFAAIAARSLAVAGVGPTKLASGDRKLDFVRIVALFGTYGIPIVLAAMAFEWLGGVAPLTSASLADAGRIAVAEIVFLLINAIVMARVNVALGYSRATVIRMSLTDAAIYLSALPYSVLLAWSWAVLGYRGFLVTLFIGAAGTYVVRKLANAHSANRQLVQRLASLSNIATALSVECSRRELLETVHEECRKVIDTSLFAIATYDEEKRELHFEIEVRDGVVIPPTVVPLGEGLNSWVVTHRQPLLIHSSREERILGLTPVDDGAQTEAWLGVPMMIHDRIIGVISMQSYRKNALHPDDVLLLKAIASQTAAALENSRLYGHLEEINTRLERRVEERTAELRETNLRVLAADRAKTEFLANMSHELRTPLNSILGFANILSEKTRDAVAPRLHGFITNIIASGTHLLTLINDLLDLAKIEAGKMELNVERVDLRSAIDSVERVVRGVATDAEVSLLTTIDSELGEADLDAARFKQILINLLSNAIKFSPRGAFVKLRCEKIDALSSSLGTSCIRIAVEDCGAGIATEELPKIFDEFYQAGSSKGRKPGTGLGLPLTKRFVELHAGKIDVRSEAGVGTTFIVELPLSMAEPVSHQRIEIASAPPP